MNPVANDQHEVVPAETNRLAGVGSPEEQAVNEVAAEYREMEVDQAKPPWRLKLDPPVEYDGAKYDVLIFDFDSLNGKDFQRAEKTFNKMYKSERNEVVLPEMKHLYQSILAAQVADVPVGLIMKLPRRYYTVVRQEALKACGSSPDEDEVSAD